MPARVLLQHLACVLPGLGVVLAGALLLPTGHAAHVVSGGLLFAMGAVGVGLQYWYAAKELRGAVNPSEAKGARPVRRC